MKPFFRSLMFFVGFALLTGAARAAWTPPETATIGSSSGTISATATAPSGFSPLVLYIWVKDPNGTWHVVATSQGVNNQPVLASGSYTFNNGGGTYVWYANYAMGGAPPNPPGGTVINGPSNTVIGTPITAATIAPLTYNGSAQSPSSASSTTPGGATVSVSAPAQTNANTYNTATVTGTGSYNGTLSNVPWTINKANAVTPTISASANPMTYGGSVTITPANGTTNLYAWKINGATVSNYNGSGWSPASGSYAGGNWTVSGLNLVLTPTSTTSFTVNFQDTGNGNYNAATSATLTETVNQAAQAAVTINSASSTTYGNTYTATATGGSGTGAYVWALGTGSTAAGAAINASTGVITANSTGTVAITAYRAGDANYSQSATTANFPITVSARPITVTLAGSKTYNGTTAATGATASITTGSLAAGDGIGYAYAATSSANAGTYPGLTTATITNAAAPTTRTGSYAITYAGNYTINGGAAQAAVTINSASSTTYGNTYTATATGGSGTGAYVWALGTGSTAAGAAINSSTGVITANSTGTVSIKVYRAGDTNYSQSATTADFPVSVGTRPITVTLAGSKTYDGTTVATGATASITTGSLAAGDGIGYAYAATSSANAGTYPGLTTATITNAAAPTTRTGSYAITYAGNYAITQAAITAATIAALPYTGSPQSPTTVAITTPAGATVTVSALPQTNVNTYTTATVTGTGNYTGTLTNVSWSIGAISQTITFPNPGAQTYGTPLTLSATASSGLSVSYSVTAGPATVAGNVLTFTGTGSVTVQATQAGNANYSAASPVSPSFNVNPRAITITRAGSKTYNGTATATGATASVTTGTLGTGDSISYAYGSTSSANFGTYSVLVTPTISNAAVPTTRTGSYTITYVGVYTVSRAALSVTSNASKTYGAANPTLTPSYSGFVNGETSAVLTGAPSLTTTAMAASAAGPYPITVTAGTLAATNYSLSYVNGTLTVNKAALSVTSNASRTYGAANPAFTPSYSGFVNGETSAVLTGAPSLTTTATAASAAGPYPITVTAGTLAATNYSLSYVNGTLTVNKAALTVTANSATKFYGTANPAFTASYTGFVNGETSAVISGNPVFTTPATATSPAGDYAVVPSLGTLTATNYSFTPFVNGTLTIIPNSPPVTRIRTATTSLIFGQPFKFYTDATDADANLVKVEGFLRGPGSYTPASPWGTWTQVLSNSFTATANKTGAVTYYPQAAGTYNYCGVATDVGGVSSLNSALTAWAGWNVWNTTGTNNSVGTLTVALATPVGTFPAKTFTGAHLVSSADWDASFANPYSTAVPAPTGLIGLTVISASGPNASPTGEIYVNNTVLQPGIYVVRATYYPAQGSSYNGATVDTQFTVNTTTVAELDTDGDGMPDWWEDQWTLNKNVNDANLDANSDGVINIDEFNLNRNPKASENPTARLIADRLRGTVSKVELQIMTNGPGTVTITRDGQAATYVFIQAQGVWSSYSSATGSGPGAFFYLKDDVDVPTTVTGSSSTGDPAFKYTLYARPDPLTTRIATRSVVLNDHFVDAITKAELDAVGGALKVRVQVAGPLAFGTADMSRMDTMRTIQFGLGSDRAGRSVGSLNFNLGSYAEPAMLSSFDFYPGPGAIQVWAPRPTHMQVQGPAGYADMQIFYDRYIVKYYGNGSYPLQSGLLDFGSTTPLATYQFDLGAIPVDASNPYVPAGATLDTAYSGLGVKLTRTLGSDVKLFEFTTAWRTAKSAPLGGPVVSFYTGYALTINHQWPARNPGAPRGNLTVLSYQAARDATYVAATASTTYSRWRPVLTKLSLKGDSASSEVGRYERLNYNTGDEKLNQAPSGRTVGYGADSHFEGGRPAVYDVDGASLSGYNEMNASGGSTYTELFWDATPGFRPNNLGTQSRLAIGLPKLTKKSFLDGAYTDASALVTQFTYYPDPIDGKTLKETAVTKQNSVTVGQMEFAYNYTTFDGKEILVTTKTDHPSAGTSLVTTLRTYSARLADTDYRDQPVSTLRPDGTKTSYAYQRGTLSGSTWSPGAGNTGPHLLIAQLDGKAGSSVASYSGATIDALDLDPNKSAVTERILDASGRVLRELTSVYTGSSNFSPLSAVYYQYDNLGNLTLKADTPTGNNRIFYEAAYTGFRKDSEADEQGIARTYQYDSYNRVDWMKRASANYSAITIPETKTAYGYDELGRLKRETLSSAGESDQLTTTYAYDTASRPTTTTAPGGITTSISYNSATQTTTTLPGGGTKVATIYFDGRAKSVTGSAVPDSTTAYAYDASGNLKTTQITAGQTGTQTVDWLGRAVSVDSATWAGGTRTVSHVYNTLGQLTKQETKSGAVSIALAHLYQYDAYGRLYREGLDTDSNGAIDPAADFGVKEYETTFQTGAPGSATNWYLYTGQKIWPYAGTNAGTFRYAAQNYTQMSGLIPAQAAHSIMLDFDRNRTESTSAVNRTAKTLTTSTTTTGTNVTLTQLSLNGMPISATNAQGQTTIQTYDGLGRLESTNDPRIGMTSVMYQPNTALVQDSIAPDYSVGSFSYDSAGRLSAQTNNNGKAAYFQYDAAGNLAYTWGDTPNPVWYEYNDLGQKTKMHTYRSGTWTGASLPSGFGLSGDVTTWNFQAATGLLNSKQDATSQTTGQTTSYQYDSMSRVAQRTDARGWITYYTYTPAGQPLTTSYSDVVTPAVTYAYDRAGRVQTVADTVTGTRTFGYYDTWSDATYDNELRNKSARVKSETLPAYFGSHVVNYDYQYSIAGRANGAASSLMIDTGSVYSVGYGYDNYGRPASVSYNSTTPFTYAYVADSNLIDTVAQSTTGYKRDYDYEANSNRRSSMKNLWGSLTASTVESRLTYDLLGQRNTEKTAGTAYMTALGRASEAGVHADYLYMDRSELDYSAKYQLTAGWGVGGFKANTDRDYSYDPIGNRTADITAGVSGSYGLNALNQYTSAPAAGGMTYDGNGNLKTDSARSYDYDGENRLIKVTQGASVWNYAYDYLGRRIRKWGTGLTEQRFIYDGWNLIAETNDVGTLTRRYAWGLDVSGSLQGAGGVGGLLLIQDGSNLYYPLYDASHNVIGLYNGSGGIDSAYEYDPFGKLQTSTGAYAAANPFRYSTKYTDNETTFTYYGHRYYSSTLGRFINRDPIEEAGGINLYAFCGNDGVNRFDYLGMEDPEKVKLEPFVVTPGEKTAADYAQDHQNEQTFREVNAPHYEHFDPATGLLNLHQSEWLTFAPDGGFPAPKPKQFSDLTSDERIILLIRIGNEARAKGDVRLHKQVARALLAEVNRTPQGIIGNLIAALLSGGAPVLERAVGLQVSRVLAAEAGELRVAVGMGQDSAEAVIVRTIGRGEKILDLVEEAKALTFSSGNEIALVRLVSGERALVMGGPGGISFENMALSRLLGHSHPYFLPATGASTFDIAALRTLEQQSSYLLEHGVLSKFSLGAR